MKNREQRIGKAVLMGSLAFILLGITYTQLLRITYTQVFPVVDTTLVHEPNPPSYLTEAPLLTPKSVESLPPFEKNPSLRGTKYQPVTAQCDATPYNTADGAWIDTTLLKTKDLRWCALSQDMLWFKGGDYHYGDTINVSCPMEWYSGVWIVHDCMNLRYTHRIDFLTWFDWPVLGVQGGIKIQKL